MSEPLIDRGRTQLLWFARLRRAAALLILAILLGACEGGSGQSGSAFVFLSVDGFGFSPGGGDFTSSVPSSTAQTSTTTACVTLSNNRKNPTITGPTALDNVVIQSYTLTLVPGGTFTFGTAVLIPAGTADAMGAFGGNSRTFSVVLVPPGAKGAPGTIATAQLKFRGRDGRGQSVETEGAVTIVFSSGITDSSCGSAGGGTGGTGGTGTGGTTM